MNIKEENDEGICYEATITFRKPQPSNTSDIIDLTGNNEHEETASNISVRVSNKCGSHQHTGRATTSRIRISTDSYNGGSDADDSVCIVFEKILPPPEVVVVNEVTVDGREQNKSAGINSAPIPVSPTVFGSYDEEPIICGEISAPSSFPTDLPPLFPEIFSEHSTSSYQPINYSVDYAPPSTSRPSCKYALRSCVVPQQTIVQTLPAVTIQSAVNLLDVKTGAQNAASEGSKAKETNVKAKIPKIQCGICLDGPDEIAASGRNFISTICGHVFCDLCIKTSLKNSATCPKCRKRITARSIHHLYL